MIGLIEHTHVCMQSSLLINRLSNHLFLLNTICLASYVGRTSCFSVQLFELIEIVVCVRLWFLSHLTHRMKFCFFFLNLLS